MNRIHLLQSLPQDMKKEQLKNVQCASLNLCAAILNYIAVAVRHVKSSFQSKPSEIYMILIMDREPRAGLTHRLQRIPKRLWANRFRN